ncbi:MAG: alcohol dehydrogenase catalytic domain-containing protein [Nitrospinae bacterium]|nr:alcohol dehydrogenase catalytic domain-containing protein [Nitrospinota bacterium]MBF0633687.1 alcohol dehydrogenase catalytic domain-containing protein [Nitrospinota bacterium]
MKALVLDGGTVRLEERWPSPSPKHGEALVRVTLAGICNTDLELARGYMGFSGVLGHEFVGVVERAQDPELIGKRVVGEINLACGECAYCRDGLKNHCPTRTVLGILGKDGAFAEYLTLPVENLHEVPSSISDEEAVFTEPLAAAFQITRQIVITPSMKVAVLGDGKLGFLAAQALQLTGGDVMVVGHHPERLEILSRRGMRAVLESETAEWGRRFDVVVDATGSSSGLESAYRLVKPRGKIALKTTVAKREPFDLNRLVIDEVTLVGSRCGPFDAALLALARKAVDVKPLISRTMPLSEGVEAMRLAVTPMKAPKILLSMR